MGKIASSLIIRVGKRAGDFAHADRPEIAVCPPLLFLQQIADLTVFREQFAEFFFAGIPLRAPVFIDGEAEADWISFLTHTNFLLVRQSNFHVAVPFQNRAGRAARLGREPF